MVHGHIDLHNIRYNLSMMVDLSVPYYCKDKIGLFSGVGMGKTIVIIMELVNNITKPR